MSSTDQPPNDEQPSDQRDPAAPNLAEHQIEALTTAFALGELDDTGLQQLYDLLRSEHGAATAQIAWQQLATVVDLRASSNETFQATLRSQLAAADQAPRERQLKRRIFQRIGRQRPQLDPVAAVADNHRATMSGNSSESAGSRRFGMLLLAGLICGLLGLAAWQYTGTRHHYYAQVRSSSGTVLIEGRQLLANDQIASELVRVTAGAELELDLRGGHYVHIHQASTVVVSTDHSLSLTNGRLVLDVAEQPLRVGLPDGRVEFQAGSQAVIEVFSGRSHVGVEAGNALFSGPHGDQQLQSNQALAGGGPPFRWIHEARWQPGSEPRLLGDPLAQRWQLSLQAVPVSADGEVHISDQFGNALRLQFGTLHVATNGQVSTYQLAEAPLRSRRIDLGIDHRGAGYLRVVGLDHDLALPVANSVLTLTTRGSAYAEAITFHTGPTRSLH